MRVPFFTETITTVVSEDETETDTWVISPNITETDEIILNEILVLSFPYQWRIYN